MQVKILWKFEYLEMDRAAKSCPFSKYKKKLVLSAVATTPLLLLLLTPQRDSLSTFFGRCRSSRLYDTAWLIRGIHDLHLIFCDRIILLIIKKMSRKKFDINIVGIMLCNKRITEKDTPARYTFFYDSPTLR